MQIQTRESNNHNNDQAFQALLQSQRELLSQMKYGTSNTKWGPSSNTPNNTSSHVECGFEKLVFNRRSSLDKLFPSVLKRMSLGGTTTINNNSTSCCNNSDTYILPSLDNLDLNMKSKLCTDDMTLVEPKKRKLHTLCLPPTTGFYDYDNSFGPAKPDFSESSDRSFELDFELLDFNDASSLIEEKDTVIDEVSVGKREKQSDSTVATEAETDDDDDIAIYEDEMIPVESPKNMCDPEEAKKVIQAFRDAMERSQHTQQSIHDWDKKMGLKRSHSKTMRLSARSRKKLRAIFKRELDPIA